MTPEMIETLKKLAASEAACDSEDFNPYDVSEVSMDDAYYAGCEDGEILLARNILEHLAIVY